MTSTLELMNKIDGRPSGAGTILEMMDRIDAKNPTLAIMDEVEGRDQDRSTAGGDVRAGFLQLQSAQAGADLSVLNDMISKDGKIMQDELLDIRARKAKIENRMAAGGVDPSRSPGWVKLNHMEKERVDQLASMRKELVRRTGRIADLSTQQAEIPINQAARRMFEAGDWAGAWQAFKSDPAGASRTVLLRSLPASAPALVLGAIGSVLGPVGAAVGSGAGEGAVEFGGVWGERLARAGIDLSDPKAVENYLAQHGKQIHDDAVRRGLIIGGTSALSGAVAGKLAGMGQRAGQKVAATGGAVAASGAGGAGGEALAQEAEGTFRPGEILAEAVGTVIAQTPATATGLMKARRGGAEAAQEGQSDAPSSQTPGQSEAPATEPAMAPVMARIRDLVRVAKEGRATRHTRQQERVYVGYVTPERAAEISAEIRKVTGQEIDVEGFGHVVDEDAINKTLRDHGDPATEAPRGNIAVTAQDFEFIPEIIAHGRIVDSERTGSGHVGVVYEYEKGDVFYYVEAVRRKRNRLAMQTMWKRPRGSDKSAIQETGPEQFTEVQRGSDENIDPTAKNRNDTLDLMHKVDAMSPGDLYVGMVDDSKVETAPRTDGKPLRREDVIGPLLKAFDVPLYQGRIKGKARLGFFRHNVEEVRIKKANDLEVVTHEMAHLLDSRVPEIKQAYRSKAFRKEMQDVSYDKTKLHEGFAEFVRLWTTQPQEAYARAPNFAAWFDDFVAKSEYGPALRHSQEQAQAWLTQDALDRARSKIGGDKDVNEHLSGHWGNFRQSATDDLHGIYRMERQLEGGTQSVGAYEVARLTRAAHSIAEGALTIGALKVLPDGSHKFVGKGLKQILDPVARDLENFLLYAVGRSANELMQQGRENLFTKTEIAAMRGLERPEFKQAFDEYQAWNKSILDFAQKKGLISGEDRAKWRRTQYLPFHRVGQKASGKTATAGEWNGVKRLTGGSENIRDVLGNMIQNSVMLIDAALKNEARLEVIKLANKHRGAKFMARIPTDSKMVGVAMKEVRKGLWHALRVDPALIPDEIRYGYEGMMNAMAPFARFMVHNQSPRGDNVVAAMVRGKPVFYEVADPILLRSLTALNRPGKNWLMKLLSAPRRISQASITLSFDFLAANLARDTLMAGVMTNHGFKPFVDSLRGMASRIKSDENYRDFIANGGGFSSYFVDENAFRTHLEKFYTKKGIDYRTVLDSPARVLFAVERIADAFEMSARLGEFRRARKRGEHARHAAYNAREVSTDFAMRGDNEYLGFLYDTVIFLKAGVNGLDRSYRGFAHDKNRLAIAGKTAMLAAVSAALYAVNRDNPLYDDLEDWDKDTHWHLFVPDGEGGQLHFRYPKIWEIGAVSSVAERQLEGILKGQPLEAQAHTLRVFKDLFKLNVMPQIVAPLYEQAINRNTFTDRPIETLSMQGRAPYARYGPYTSRTLRTAGEATRDMPRAMQINPARAEALLRGYLNTWAMYGLTLADAALFDDMPDLRVDQYPVVRRFYRQQPGRHSRYVSKLYDAIREATEARRTLRFMDRVNRPELADELENKFANRVYSQMSRAQRHLRAINQEMRKVVYADNLEKVREIAWERGGMTNRPRLGNALARRPMWNDIGALKRWLLDDMAKERNTFAKSVMRDVEQRKLVDR